MRTTDNNYKGVEIEEKEIADLKEIANVSLTDLAEKYPNLLIFPNQLGEHKDGIEESYLFTIQGNILKTENCMGFVSSNETELHISSRFYPKKNDYFLHYMLQKVFKINILDFDISTKQDENVWDIFLLYLFPYFLKKAINQGLFKEYQRKEYNDANVKGTINVAQHIRQNLPFMGKIAYKMREHTYDNRITQLIRHTIEFIRNHQFGANILHNDFETKQAVLQVNAATTTYNKLLLNKIIQANEKSILHPFFTEYEPLRKICLQILRNQGLNFNQKDKDKVYGIVFDGAWLWEEYLNTFLGKNFTHAENKTGKNPIYIFENDKTPRYPDFENDKTPRYPDFYNKKMVLDAKYKRFNTDPSRDDLHQIITYMYVLELKRGAFIYPNEEKNVEKEVGKLKGHGGTVHTFGLKIEQECDKFQDFIAKMKENEENILNKLR